MEPLINNKISAENQKIFLNRELVPGIQSIQANQNLGLDKLSYAGIGNKTLNYIPKSEQGNTFNINSLLINKDSFLQYVTGSSFVNLYILRDQSDLINNYSLLSGYFTDFQCSYSIGNLAEISATINVVGDAGKINTGNMDSSQVNDLTFINTGNFNLTGNLLIPHIGSINLNISEYTTNRVQNFTLKVTPIKIAVYNMGRKSPKRIDYLGAEISLDTSFEMGDYSPLRLRNIPESGIIKNINIQINDYSTNAPITNYSFSGLNLINETYSVEQNSNVIVNQSFVTKIYA